jgi:hypothetical protein
MIKRLMRALTVASITTCVLSSGQAEAQTGDGWQVSFVPLYFWATALNGQLSAGPASVPIALDFSDAADHLGGAFSFHFEAVRGRWGVLMDLNFIQLASSADFAVGPVQDVQGDFELDNIMFEAGALYLVNEARRLAVIGGLRTYTLAPTIAFTGSLAGIATPVDTSQTSPNAFGGVVFRPAITDKWTFISRADIGGGDADFTWSALAGVEYRFRPWGGLEFGYKALGIDVESGNNDLRQYDVTHYGPIVGIRFHWAQR